MTAYKSTLLLSLSMCLLLSATLLGTAPASVLASEPPSVIVYEIKELAWSDTIESLGTLRANETVTLTTTVTDTITKIHFEDGQRVEAGTLLAEMTNEEESAMVSEMNARFEEAKRQFQRMKNLPKSGAVSESLYDQREREFRAAKAQLLAMKTRLNERLIIAPFSGILGLRTISVGALVEPGDEIVRLTDDSVMKLDFSIPSIYLQSLEIDLPIEATSAAFPDQVFKGNVKSVDSQIDPITRSIVVRAQIPNPGGKLKPGLLMHVFLHYNARRSVVIPEEALMPLQDTQHVLVVDPDSRVAEKRQVIIGKRQLGLVEIRTGLKARELVITHGTTVARPGEAVTIKGKQTEETSIEQIITAGDSAS